MTSCVQFNHGWQWVWSTSVWAWIAWSSALCILTKRINCTHVPNKWGTLRKESISNIMKSWGARNLQYQNQAGHHGKPIVHNPPLLDTLLTMECALQSHHIQNVGRPAASTTPAAQMPAKKSCHEQIEAESTFQRASHNSSTAASPLSCEETY